MSEPTHYVVPAAAIDWLIGANEADGHEGGCNGWRQKYPCKCGRIDAVRAASQAIPVERRHDWRFMPEAEKYLWLEGDE